VQKHESGQKREAETQRFQATAGVGSAMSEVERVDLNALRDAEE